MATHVTLYRPGETWTKKMSASAWKLLQTLKRTNGYMELRPGQVLETVSKPQQPKQSLPPEVKEFAIKTKAQLTEEITNDLEKVYSDRLNAADERAKLLLEKLEALEKLVDLTKVPAIAAQENTAAAAKPLETKETTEKTPAPQGTKQTDKPKGGK